MTDVIDAKVPAGTHTIQRRWAKTETPKLSEWHPPAPQAGILAFVSGGKEHTTTLYIVGPILVSPMHDEADAVLNTADEDLLTHIRRTRLDFAQFEPSLHSTRIDREYIRFRGKLIATLLDEPIEDGVTHPAEGLIDEALRADSSGCQNWLSQVLDEHYDTRPSLCASIVRCIGRLDYDRVGRWGMRVADDALRNKDAEVREAAIRGLEAWGGPAALDMLRRHEDTEAWLNDYVRQVIVDLSGTTS